VSLIAADSPDRFNAHGKPARRHPPTYGLLCRDGRAGGIGCGAPHPRSSTPGHAGNNVRSRNQDGGSALLQDLLNKLAGASGKPYYCDDAYHIGILAQKCASTKGELLFDIELLRDFLTQLKSNGKVKDLAKAICDAKDERHWDNSWGAATVKRMLRCSKEHCFGPK
jgi:hypothetical protein